MTTTTMPSNLNKLFCVYYPGPLIAINNAPGATRTLAPSSGGWRSIQLSYRDTDMEAFNNYVIIWLVKMQKVAMLLSLLS